jgi:large subunit ribosomal protein L20
VPRVKRGTKRHDRRKKILKLAKGYYLNKSKLYRAAKESVEKALGYAYRDRKVRKREFRKLWIIRIGAAARQNGINYNQLMHGLKVAGVDLDRKILADIALQDPAAFSRLAETAKKAANA